MAITATVLCVVEVGNIAARRAARAAARKDNRWL
jgi:hypothetical protein